MANAPYRFNPNHLAPDLPDKVKAALEVYASAVAGLPLDTSDVASHVKAMGIMAEITRTAARDCHYRTMAHQLLRMGIEQSYPFATMEITHRENPSAQMEALAPHIIEASRRLEAAIGDMVAETLMIYCKCIQ